MLREGGSPLFLPIPRTDEAGERGRGVGEEPGKKRNLGKDADEPALWNVQTRKNPEDNFSDALV